MRSRGRIRVRPAANSTPSGSPSTAEQIAARWDASCGPIARFAFGRPCALDEEPRSIGGEDGVRIGLEVGDGHRRDDGGDLDGGPEPDPARGEDRDGGCDLDDRVDRRRDGVDDVLAVVQDQQAVRVPEPSGDRIGRCLIVGGPCADGQGDRGGDEGRIVEILERDVPGVASATIRRVRQLEREPRLAGSTGTQQGQQRGRGHQVEQVLDLAAATDEARRRPRDVPGRIVAPDRHRPEARLLHEDLAVALGEHRRGFDPELVIHVPAVVVIGGQGVGLPPGAVQREHVGRPSALVQGAGAHERAKVDDRLVVASDLDHRGEPPLDRAVSQFVEPSALGDDERRIAEIGEQVAAPQVECG